MYKAGSGISGFSRAVFDHVTLYHDFVQRIADKDRLTNSHATIVKLRMKYVKEMQDMRWETFVNFIVLWIAIVIGMLVMMQLEGWDANEAFFWSVVTISTVGYGDYVPTKTSSKIFTIFFIILGGFAILNAFTSLVWNPIKMLNLKNEMKVIRQFDHDMSETQFNAIISHPLFHNVENLRGDQARITKAEFVLTVLNLMNKVNDQDIVLAADLFDKFDVNSDGNIY